VKELLPGNWYFLWSVVMEHMVTPIKVQPKDIRVQSVWTKDGKDLAVGGAIVYYVKEPMKAILEVDDYDQSIQVIALAVICEWVSQHTVAELREDMEGLKKKLLADVREGSQGWGLKIQSVEITDIGVTRNIRLLTNGEPISGIL
jgi:regulator of protease activity HflC (stomatin/prohibitin superfamily)